jgi:hypothetical protein
MKHGSSTIKHCKQRCSPTPGLPASTSCGCSPPCFLPRHSYYTAELILQPTGRAADCCCPLPHVHTGSVPPACLRACRSFFGGSIREEDLTYSGGARQLFYQSFIKNQNP